jgi:hypothetical protein
MTSYEIVKLLQQFIKVIADKSNLISILSTAEAKGSLIARSERDILNSSDNNQAWRKITDLNHLLINGIPADLKKTGSRKIYAELEQMLSEIESLSATYEESTRPLATLGIQLAILADRYEIFLQESSKENTLALIEIASDIKKSFDDYLWLAMIIERALNREESVDKEGYAKISLLLSFEPSYKNLVIKLTAIDHLYNELCNLLEVSSAEYPLRVARMEVGSLWLKIFGESKAVALLTQLIERAVGYLHRRFTNEGQITSIPRQVESIEAVLRLTENLQERGVDTSEAKENLQKSAVIISAKLNDLLLGSPSVTVNDRNFSVGEAATEKYLKESRRLLLEEGKET